MEEDDDDIQYEKCQCHSEPDTVFFPKRTQADPVGVKKVLHGKRQSGHEIRGKEFHFNALTK